MGLFGDTTERAGRLAEGEFARMVSDGPRRQIEIRNRQRSARDTYHWLLTTSWSVFAALGAGAYLLANALFALLYLAQPGDLTNGRPSSFEDAFFFSVQTIGTIGYGALSPRTLYANLVMTVENFFGLSFVAVATGLIFARVSRPTARIMFSDRATIALYDGRPTLMFRAANQRANEILEAEVQISVAMQAPTAERRVMRRLQDLKPLRSRSPLFALTWTILHVVDESSPLFGATAQSMHEQQMEIIVVLSGVDATFAQRVHARRSYVAREIVWDRQFADILSVKPDGRRMIDYALFNAFEDLDG